jgi:hypothetical protein
MDGWDEMDWGGGMGIEGRRGHQRCDELFCFDGPEESLGWISFFFSSFFFSVHFFRFLFFLYGVLNYRNYHSRSTLTS